MILSINNILQCGYIYCTIISKGVVTMIKVNIKQVLNQKDKSIYWLAKKTNLAYPGLLRLVKNETNSIHFNTLEEIMNVLDINSFDDILEIVPDNEE